MKLNIIAMVLKAKRLLRNTLNNFVYAMPNPAFILFSTFKVSFKRIVQQSNTMPTTSNKQKIPFQEVKLIIAPPTIGAVMGAMPLTAPSKAKNCAKGSPVYMSVAMLFAKTTPPAPATP